MMTLDEAVEIAKREVQHIERQFGAANRTMAPDGWVALFAQRLGHLSQAAAGRSHLWFVEELVKTAATALAALQVAPDVSGLSVDGDEGWVEIRAADTDRPRIHSRVVEPPPSAVRVALDAKQLWIKAGAVYAEK